MGVVATFSSTVND
jgi:hypothetical protein